MTDGRPVFVYGTLRPGRSNWAVAAPWCLRHEPATLPGFGLYALDHPVIVPLDDPNVSDVDVGHGVRGDLLWLDPPVIDHALARLDAFEGVVHGDPRRSYYHRASHPARVETGGSVESWVYVPGDDLLARVRPDRRVHGDDWPA